MNKHQQQPPKIDENNYVLNSDADRLVVIKLLSLSQKLHLFVSPGVLQSADEQLHAIVGDMILSDLIDEQAKFYEYFQQHAKRLPNKLIIASYLTGLELFENFDFHALFVLNKQNALKDIIIRLTVFKSQYPKDGEGMFASRITL